MSEGRPETAEIKVVAHHVDESPSSAMLGEGVLMVLTFGDAHLVLDVRVS